MRVTKKEIVAVKYEIEFDKKENLMRVTKKEIVDVKCEIEFDKEEVDAMYEALRFYQTQPMVSDSKYIAAIHRIAVDLWSVGVN